MGRVVGPMRQSDFESYRCAYCNGPLEKNRPVRYEACCVACNRELFAGLVPRRGCRVRWDRVVCLVAGVPWAVTVFFWGSWWAIGAAGGLAYLGGLMILRDWLLYGRDR
jgi:hypothetical protein